MIRYNQYIFAESLEQAYELNQKKANVLLGGTGWLKMQNRQYQTAIDLSHLGLDLIEEEEDAFYIGAMVTLHQLETQEALNAYTKGAVKKSVQNIVGVQFRNCVTIGGSLFGRFGFSDVLTLLLVLDTSVQLYHAGWMPLREFVNMPYNRDVLVQIKIEKTKGVVVYDAFRNQSTDFPILTCANACINGEWRTAIGARPGKAQLIVMEMPNQQEISSYADKVSSQFVYGSNMRGSGEYRKMLAAVLMKRNIEKLLNEME